MDRLTSAKFKLLTAFSPRDRPHVGIEADDGTLRVRVGPGITVPILPTHIFGFPVQVTRLVWRGFGAVPRPVDARALNAREKFLAALGVPCGLPPRWLRGTRIAVDAQGVPYVVVQVPRGCHPSIPYQMDDVLFRREWVD